MEQPNLDYIIKLSGNDEVVKQKFITTLKNELPFEIEAYFVSLRSNELHKAAECVHKLKHKIGILGLEAGYNVAEAFEEELKNNQIKIQTEFDTILYSMQSFVESL